MKSSKAKIFQDIIIDVRENHRLMCVEMRERLKELEKPFLGLRLAFKTPRVKNRTYKIKGLELKHLDILPINSRKRKSTGFIAVCTNASFFGYALDEVKLDFVKMQKDGYDDELLKLERKLHEEFSSRTRSMVTSAESDLNVEGILESDADFYLASKGYVINNLHKSSRHQGIIKKLEYNPYMAEINTAVETNHKGTHIIDNETHIVNIWG